MLGKREPERIRWPDTRHIKAQPFANTILIVGGEDLESVVLDKNTAIQLAEAILLHFRVPFCNRVKGEKS